ncbi:MAG: PAS domain S-box protein [Nitrospira sp.]|nr:PAS domain S-box protein [Nitrospira sp.]
MSATSDLLELDLLRRQVADLARELADRDRVLRERTRHLHVAQALAHLGSWSWDLTNGEVEWSDELYRIFGYAPQSCEMRFNSFVSAVVPDDRDRILALIDDALVGAAPYDMECRIVRPDGEVRTIHCCAEFLRDSSGQPIRMSGTALDVTDRKQAESALQERETHFRTLIEHSSDIITVLNSDGTIRFESPSFERLLGYGQRELDGRIAFEFVHQEDLPAVIERFRLLIQRPGTPQMAEFRFRHKDGSWRRLEGIGMGTCGPHGQCSVVVNSRDITERKRTEEMLRTSQEKLRQALRASGTGLWDWNTETDEVILSEEWKRQLGYEPAEISDAFEAWTVLLHPEDREVAMAYVRDYVSRREGDYRQEFRLKHKDGGYRWIEARASFVAEPDGRRIRLLGSHTDITAHKRMEEALRESEERYRMLIELAPCGAFVLCEGQTAYINRTGVLIMGAKDPHEILSRPIFEFIHPDYHQKVRENVQNLLSGGVSIHSAERMYLKMDGTPVPVQVEIARITWNGKPAILCLFSDITERKRGEDRARELNLALAQAMPGISRVDVAGRYLEMNQAYASMLGYEPSELLGRTWEPTVHPEDLHLAQHAYEELLEKGKAEFECRAVRKDGSIFFKQVLMVTSNASVGDFLGHHCFMRDITARKQAEDALWQSRQAIRALHDISSAQGRSFNERVEALLQLGCRFFALPIGMETLVRGDELEVAHVHAPGMTFDPGMHLSLGKSYCSEALRQDGPVCITHAAASPEWQRHPAYAALKLESYIGTAINGSDGVYGTLCFASVHPREKGFSESDRDFIQLMARWLGGELDRQSALASLCQSEERYRTLYDATPSMYFTVDRTGIIRSVNQYGAQYLGYRVEDLVGKSVASILFEEDRTRVCVEMDTFFRQPEGVARWEFRKVRSDGAVLWVREFARVLQGLAGEPVALIVCDDITEVKRAEVALRASEERFRMLVEEAPLGITMMDEQKRYVKVNQAFCKLVGFSSEELLGQSYTRFTHLDDLPKKLALTDEMPVGRRQGYRVEKRYVRKDGQAVWVVVNATRSTLVEAAEHFTVSIIEDITERKRAEEALRLTQFSVDQAVEAILWVDSTARIFNVNETACRMLGYARQELTTMTMHDIDPNFPAERWAEHWNQLKERGALAFEATYWSRTGSVLEMEVTFNYLRYDEKEYGCAILRDIGERKRAQAELHRSHTFLRQVIDTDPHLIFAKDREGRFAMANKAVADRYGTMVEDLIGKSDAEFNANSEEVEQFRQSDLAVMNSAQDRFIPEERITDAEGRTRWLQTVKRPIFDDQGQVCMVLGAATDITERKRMEETLLQRERDLSAAVQERERISQDLHDGILQSLYAVGLGLEAGKPVIKNQQDHAAKKFMTTVDQAIGQLKHVMTEVRNFIAGLESQVMQGGDFSTALRTMVHTMSISSSARCRVRIDNAAARRLSTEQAIHIINIVREGLSNALRHSGAKQITVSLRDLLHADRLAVTDDGIGFNPRSVEGVGHGLINMAARAQKVRGLFAIHSKPDKGTRISVDLPKDTQYAQH